MDRPQGSEVKDNGEVVISASKRPDGTYRKERKVRPGYVPPDEAVRYVSRGKEHVEERARRGIPGAELAEPVAKPKKKKKGKSKPVREQVIQEPQIVPDPQPVLDASKELRRLDKLLRQIEALELKDDLNDEQRAKVARKEETLARIAELV